MPNAQNKKYYKIGTRGSLLALTQCNQVRLELERLTGDHFELEIIKTQGDLNTSAPLWQMEGKDFFTKELDEALLSGRVDLVVHSYKDLGSLRPKGISLAAVTKRTYAHDILLIKQETILKLAFKKEFIVGTSSPRRMVNLKNGLASFLPKGAQLEILPKMLRGNVNTRISKLQAGDYDAIALALPGLERLALSTSSRLELEKLLKGLNFLILPQSVFPSSASQGALAIECAENRSDDGELFNKLLKIKDENTFLETQRERAAFNQYGGGCHLAVGINVRKKDSFFIHTHLGEIDNKPISLFKLEGAERPNLPPNSKVFRGLSKEDLLVKKRPLKPNLSSYHHLYVTSMHCLDSIKIQPPSLWSAGVKTLKSLAAQGFWVNGCADSLGDEEILNLRQSKAIALMINTDEKWAVLSNDMATSTLGEVIPCYTRTIEENLNLEFIEHIHSIDVFYWSSFFQYLAYLKRFPEIKNKIHAAGIGKTYRQFLEHNISVVPMGSMAEFNQWTKT